MLFEDPNRTSTEEYYNPKITKVEMTIEGVPNQLYSKGMLAYQQWDEINKYFALTSKRDKETDKVAKDLNFSDTNIEKYFTTRFALWLDLRSTDDNTLHGLQMTIHYTTAAEESRMPVKGSPYKLKKNKNQMKT